MTGPLPHTLRWYHFSVFLEALFGFSGLYLVRDPKRPTVRNAPHFPPPSGEMHPLW
jgi:hypothetical protein